MTCLHYLKHKSQRSFEIIYLFNIPFWGVTIMNSTTIRPEIVLFSLKHKMILLRSSTVLHNLFFLNT